MHLAVSVATVIAEALKNVKLKSESRRGRGWRGLSAGERDKGGAGIIVRFVLLPLLPFF